MEEGGGAFSTLKEDRGGGNQSSERKSEKESERGRERVNKTSSYIPSSPVQRNRAPPPPPPPPLRVRKKLPPSFKPPPPTPLQLPIESQSRRRAGGDSAV